MLLRASGAPMSGHLTSRYFYRESLSRVKIKSIDFVARACAAQTLCTSCSKYSFAVYGRRPRHPWRFFNPSSRGLDLLFTNAAKSKQKGPPSSKFLFLCVLTHSGRENAFPTRLSLRLNPFNLTSVSLRCSGNLSRWIKQSSDFVAEAFASLT